VLELPFDSSGEKEGKIKADSLGLGVRRFQKDNWQGTIPTTWSVYLRDEKTPPFSKKQPREGRTNFKLPMFEP